jgi:hypothetical protein
MFVLINHDIHDPATFQQCAAAAMPPPDGLDVHRFLASRDFHAATCLYEAASVDEVRAFVDGARGTSSTQRYTPVAEEHAMGLPRRAFT